MEKNNFALPSMEKLIQSLIKSNNLALVLSDELTRIHDGRPLTRKDGSVKEHFLVIKETSIINTAYLNLLESLVSNNYNPKWEVEGRSIDELVDPVKAEEDTFVPNIEEINGL